MEQTTFTPVELVHNFTVPTENIFNAWTEPAIIRQWLFRGETDDIADVLTDLQRNGRFSIVKKAEDGQLQEHHGSYHEIARPTLLSFSLEAPHLFAGVSNVVVRITAAENGSVMNFLQTGADPAIVEASWRKMFMRLDVVVRSL